MKIGQLSRILGVSTDTLRYYETHGLLNPSSRNASGYRLYDEANVKHMHFILRAKEVGFSLREIQELLNIKIDKHQHRCEEVKEITIQKRNLLRKTNACATADGRKTCFLKRKEALAAPPTAEKRTPEA